MCRLQNLIKAKDKEIKDLIQAKNKIIQNYEKYIKDAEGKLKKHWK